MTAGIAIAEPETPSATLARQGAVDAGGSFLAALLIGLVSAVVVSRLYGVSVIGEFALVSIPWTMLAQLSTLGEQLALVRSVAAEPRRSCRTTAVFAVVLAFSVVFTCAGGLVVTAVSVALLRGAADRPDLVAPSLVLIVLYVVVDNPSWNLDRFLVAVHRPRATFGVRIAQLVVLLVASIVLSRHGGVDVWDLTWATVLAAVVALIARIGLSRSELAGRPSRAALSAAIRELPAFLRFGVRLLPGNVVGGVTPAAASWLIGATRPVSVLGGYTRASGLASRLEEGSYRLSDVLLPSLARWCNEGRHQTAAKEFSRLRLLVTVALAAGCGVIAGAATGLLDVFGPDFSRAAWALALLVLAYSASLLATMHHMMLLALVEPGLASRLELLGAGVTLCMLFPLTVAFGASGAAAAFLAGFVTQLVVAVRWTDRGLAVRGATLEALPWGRLTVAAAGAFAAAKVTNAMVPGIAGGLAGVAGGLVVFGLVAVAIGLVPDRDGGVAEATASAGATSILYVVSRFPKVTETFVYEEVAAMRRLGFDTPMLSMTMMSEGVVQPRAVELAPLVRSGTRSPARLVWSQLWWAGHRPGTLARLWWRVLWANRASAGELLKGLVATLVAADWARQLDRRRPAHIHAHFATWGAHGAHVMAELLGLTYSFTAHAHDVFGKNAMLEDKLRRAEFAVVISEFERRYVAQLLPSLAGKLRVVHCGVDLAAFEPGPAPSPGPARRLLCIASLADYKGHPILFEACALLRDRGVGVVCTLVGDGPERRALERLVDRLELGDVVRFAGRLPAPEVRALLRDTDIVVQPSVIAPGGHIDGIPVALMEALASERPVVASELSGIPELVEDEITGLLVPPGDALALADAVERLVHDPALRARLGHAGRQRVEQQFAIDVTARQLGELFAPYVTPVRQIGTDGGPGRVLGHGRPEGRGRTVTPRRARPTRGRPPPGRNA